MLAWLRRWTMSRSPNAPSASSTSLGPDPAPIRTGRHRRPPALPAGVTNVTIVLRDGREIALEPDSSPALAMTQVAALLARW